MKFSSSAEWQLCMVMSLSCRFCSKISANLTSKVSWSCQSALMCTVYCVCFEMFWNINLNLAVHKFWMQCYVFEALAMLFQHEIDLCLAYSATSFLEWLSSGFPSSMPASLCSFPLANCLFFCKKPNKYHNINTDLWPLWHTTHDRWSLNGMQSPGWQGNIRKPSVSDQCGEHDQLPGVVAKSMVKTGENAIPVCANCYLVLFPPTQTAQTVTVVLDLLQFPTKSPCSRCFHLFSPFSCVL